MNVIKYNGEKEPFSEKKAYNSARRAGASDSEAKKIVNSENLLRKRKDR